MLVQTADAILNPPRPQHFGYVTPETKHYQPEPVAARTLDRIVKIEGARQRAGFADISLEEALFYTHGRKATNPRDAVYVLLGISTDALKLNLMPNHKLSTEEVFQDCATRILSNAISLRLLSAAGLEKNAKLSKLPSWVPDWTSFLNLKLLGYSEHELYQTTFGRPFEWKPRVSFADDGALIVTGWVFDSFKYLGTPFPEPPKQIPTFGPRAAVLVSDPKFNFTTASEMTYASELLSTLEASEHLVASEFDELRCFEEFTWPPRPGIQGQVQALMDGNRETRVFYSESSTFHEQNCARLPFDEFCRAITAAKPDPEGSFADNDSKKNLHLDNNSVKMRYLDFKRISSAAVGRPFTPTLASEADIRTYGCRLSPFNTVANDLPFYKDLSHAITGRRFCVTHSKRIALVPAMVRQGDFPILLEGAAVPFVARVADRLVGVKVAFKLVGECYVYGCMIEKEMKAAIDGLTREGNGKMSLAFI